MISVVIPVYNAERTLNKCLNSIAAQTYKDFEVIAVNDGSDDGSEEILKKYQNEDGRFKYININHGGASHARNAGLKLAAGEYLQFTDADDELDPEMFYKLITLMEKNGADLAICRFEHPFFKTYVGDEVFDLSNPDDLIKLYSDTYGVVMPWNKIWRRSCFTRPFDEEVSFSEDELGNLANLPNVKKAVTSSEYLYRYFFAKKEDDAEEKSCVNNIINTQAFWENKTSFYYKGASLLPKRRAYIEQGIKEGKLSIKTPDDMAYLRLIDYCFWQMPAYIGMGIPEEGLAAENANVFLEEDFIAGFKAQQKYGFSLKNLSREKTRELAKKFTALCYKTYAEKDGSGFKTAYAFISIFLKLFAEVTGELNPANQNAGFLLDLQNGATEEARYVNAVCGA